MGQFTTESFLRITQLEILLKINGKMIKIIENQSAELILKGRNDMRDILRDKIEILKNENEKYCSDMEYIYKYNKIR
ncbi:hypothetical protein [Cetobacterium sp.]|uniref:hypothetical protein n=1 Tax=Cetobacterium sp. TaxID=2071632 RepID=UPI003F359C1B